MKSLLIDETTTLGVLLDRAVEAHEHAEFLMDDTATITYRDFRERVMGHAAFYARSGAEPGDRVASMVDNSIDAVVAMFAAFCAHCIYVPLNTALRGESLAHQLALTSPRVLTIGGGLLDRLKPLSGPSRPPVIISRDDADSDDLLSSGAVRVSEAQDQARLAPTVEANAGDAACLMFTGGTTGPAKACTLSHRYLLNSVLSSRHGREPEDPAYTCLPLYHLNATAATILTMALGSRITIAKRFSVSRFWPDIERSEATYTNLLGTMAALVASAPDSPAMVRCRGQLKHFRSTPFPPDVQQVFRERFQVADVKSVSSYGMTETGALTVGSEGMPVESAGVPSDSWEVQVVDDEDQPVPVGRSGEIVGRPRRPGVMFDGYWGQPEKTLEVTRNLWFHTGDIGRFDENGFLYFVDRKKDYIRRRGENISCFEVEAPFRRHPDVIDVAAYGVESELGEEDVQISVVVADGSDIAPQRLLEWSVSKLPYFAVPRYVQFVGSLPTSEVGRVLKRQLKANAAAGRWDRESIGMRFERR
ncbi:MAG: AMP-binding protein [bacterium]|nr:AMP-binding protein [bacterium]